MSNFKHGLSRSNPKLYRVWCDMNKRCKSKSYHQFKNYGGIGISVCDEWSDVVLFCKWAIENGWKEGLEIDRIDNNKNYEPSNCKFITHSENVKIGKLRVLSTNKTGVTGVSLKSNNKYEARIWDNSTKKSIYIGTFDTIEQAKIEREKFELEL